MTSDYVTWSMLPSLSLKAKHYSSASYCNKCYCSLSIWPTPTYFCHTRAFC